MNSVNTSKKSPEFMEAVRKWAVTVYGEHVADSTVENWANTFGNISQIPAIKQRINDD